MVGLIAAVATIVYGQITRRQGAEQFRLAREEALRHPQLEVTGVALLDAKEVEQVAQVREAQKAWRELLNRMKADLPVTQEDFGDRQYTTEQAHYEGPRPDLILTFELYNKGRTTANTVSGEVRFDPDVLEPLQFPGLSGEKPGGWTRLALGSVPPSAPKGERVFKIPLLRKGSGKTTVVVVFSTPDGDYFEKPLELDVP